MHLDERHHTRGVQDGHHPLSLCSPQRQTPQNTAKPLRYFYSLRDILSSSLSRNVSLETISSCLQGGFSTRKPLCWVLGNPPACSQDSTPVIQRLEGPFTCRH